jgi:hypothetical protein
MRDFDVLGTSEIGDGSSYALYAMPGSGGEPEAFQRTV